MSTTVSSTLAMVYLDGHKQKQSSHSTRRGGSAGEGGFFFPPFKKAQKTHQE